MSEEIHDGDIIEQMAFLDIDRKLDEMFTDILSGPTGLLGKVLLDTLDFEHRVVVGVGVSLRQAIGIEYEMISGIKLDGVHRPGGVRQCSENGSRGLAGPDLAHWSRDVGCRSVARS